MPSVARPREADGLVPGQFRPGTSGPRSTRRMRLSLVPFRSCALWAAGFAGAGCASYTPRPLDPAGELARLSALEPGALAIEYAQPGAAAARTPRAFDPRDGLDEAELAALALTINPALRARRAEVGEARALLVSAELLPNPDLGAFVRSGVGGSSGTAVGLDAMFALLRPDERPARRALAESEVDAVRAGIAADELHLVAQVRRARIA